MPRMPYHIVELSPWPIMLATSSMFFMLSLINWFHFYDQSTILPSMTMLLLCMFQWWRDMIREATMMGKHTPHVQKGLRIGMMLFIISEICFFFSFFWAFFHSSLTPTSQLGCSWPPVGINIIDPMSVPLLNTAILLTSGFTVTWSHHSLQLGKRSATMMTLLITITLGMYFSFLQINEYMNSKFTIADSIYGSIFFVSTGFHGLHVIIGTLFLIINLFRAMKWHFSKLHHFSFEAAAWYWHFVDVVWICLYVSIYWWGSL